MDEAGLSQPPPPPPPHEPQQVQMDPADPPQQQDNVDQEMQDWQPSSKPLPLSSNSTLQSLFTQQTPFSLRL
ncbi:hypothetical protein Syun_027787 [Stephania yunnanensis]|uniref:Uncharacterized protein n=1 Tax=Stephania yunnanensis TaxID=152371 RepID=A0AAP0EG90_9MAGN